MKNKLLFCISLLSLSFFSITSAAFRMPMMQEEAQGEQQEAYQEESNTQMPSSEAYPNLNSSFCFYFPNSPECLVGGAYYVEPYSFYNNYRPYGFWYGRDYGYGRYGRDYGYGRGYGRHRDWRGSRDKHHGMNRGDNDRRSNFSDRMNRNDNVRKIDRSGFKNRSKSFGKRR